MRVLAALAVALGILGVLYLLAMGPRPETRAQAAARAAVDSVTRVRLDAYAAGDFERWARELRRDGLVLTADPVAPLIGPDAAIARMRADLGPAIASGLALDLSPRRWMTGATRRGRLAWIGGELEYGGTTGGERTALPLRHTAAHVLRDGEWTLILDHYSRGLGWDELQEGARAERLPSPASLAAPVKDGDLRDLVKRFNRWTSDLTRVRMERQVVLVGPVTGEMAAGDSAAKVMLAEWKQRLGALRPREDGVRAWLADGRGAGWVAANVEASPPEWGGAKVPLRVTSVWRSAGEDSWRLVVAHVSVGVTDHQPSPTAASVTGR